MLQKKTCVYRVYASHGDGQREQGQGFLMEQGHIFLMMFLNVSPCSAEICFMYLPALPRYCHRDGQKRPRRKQEAVFICKFKGGKVEEEAVGDRQGGSWECIGQCTRLNNVTADSMERDKGFAWTLRREGGVGE